MLNLSIYDLYIKHVNTTIDANYKSREDRNRFASENIKHFKTAGKILNIGGGGERHLQSHLGSDFNVFEIDVVGDCDLQLNLDGVDSLPFASDSFDVCCAFDVLEHLEQFHLINSELLRVSSSIVLISLPNSAADVLDILLNRSALRRSTAEGVFSKFYGLPLVNPNDRHRWYLYIQDIVRFYYLFSIENSCDLEFWTPRKKGFRRRVLGPLLGRHINFTFLTPHIWIKLTKQGKHSNYLKEASGPT